MKEEMLQRKRDDVETAVMMTVRSLGAAAGGIEF